MRIMAAKSKRNLILCTWNVRSLVESFGDMRICRKRPGGSNVKVGFASG